MTSPNAGAGPFRKLAAGELGNLRSEPYALADDTVFARDPSVVDADGDPATFEVHGYFAVTFAPEGEEASVDDAPNAIVRHGALDARSFDRQRVVVLAPELAWEGGTVGAPMVLRRGAELWMYYAAAGGIGLGLDTALKIIQRHGGDIVLSRRENPTVFSIRLPASLASIPPT